jgi:hypothetical protein
MKLRIGSADTDDFLNWCRGRSVSDLPGTLFGPTIKLEMHLSFRLMSN